MVLIVSLTCHFQSRSDNCGSVELNWAKTIRVYCLKKESFRIGFFLSFFLFFFHHSVSRTSCGATQEVWNNLRLWPQLKEKQAVSTSITTLLASWCVKQQHYSTTSHLPSFQIMYARSSPRTRLKEGADIRSHYSFHLSIQLTGMHCVTIHL